VRERPDEDFLLRPIFMTASSHAPNGSVMGARSRRAFRRPRFELAIRFGLGDKDQ